MNVELKIQEQENLYYFYHNWKAGMKNKIHKSDCKQCNFGTCKRVIQTRGENGVWVGPFSTLDLCHDYIAEKLKLPPVEPHNCCN
jgi:hypothetical protein